VDDLGEGDDDNKEDTPLEEITEGNELNKTSSRTLFEGVRTYILYFSVRTVYRLYCPDSRQYIFLCLCFPII